MSKKDNKGIFVAAATLVVMTVIAFSVGAARAGAPDLLTAPPVTINGHDASPYEVLVQFRPGRTIEAITASLEQGGIDILGARKFRLIDWYRVNVSTSYPLADTLAMLNAHPDVIRAEPNYCVYLLATPDDPLFGELWGMVLNIPLNNYGIGAPEAWDVRTDASSIITAVIDDGVDYTHEDLDGQFWVNEGEAPPLDANGVDDDLDGYVDDYLGWDFAYNDNDPQGGSHGTHVAGTIAAVGNNATGVAGVCWTAKIMPLRFISSRGGNTADAIDAIEYAVIHGAKVLNFSWESGGFSQAFQEAIYATEARDAVFVAGAGNNNSDNDETPSYPASYDNRNIISVAASAPNGTLVSLDTDPDDMFSWGSNYGPISVDLAAPGGVPWPPPHGSERPAAGIMSTTPGNDYQFSEGTSQAAAHVSGACALVWAEYPYLTNLELRERILRTVTPAPDAPDPDPTYVPIGTSVATEGILNAGLAVSDYYSIVTPSPLPTGKWGVPYSAQIVTVPAGLPLGKTGALPAGLTMDATGLISGTPSQENTGTATFTVTITGWPTSREYDLTIEAQDGKRDTVWLQVHSTPFEGAAIFGESNWYQQPIHGTANSGHTYYYAVYLAPKDDPVILAARVHLYAPVEYNGLYFLQWDVVSTGDYGSYTVYNRDVNVIVDANTTATAVYGEPDTLWVNDDIADDYGMFSFIGGGFTPMTVFPGDDGNTGLGPDEPKRHIQAMLDDPPVPLREGMRILVSKGTYQENIVLGPQHAGITLQGAGWGPEDSVIDGGSLDMCVRAERWQGGTILGFEIKNGMPASGGGGAIRLSNGSDVTIIRNYLHDNAAEEGGCIAIYSSAARVESNILENNTASGEGGAIYSSESYVDIFGNDISGHTAVNGGAIRSFLTVGDIQKNWIYGNDATRQGGGIYVKSCDLSIIDNYIGQDRELNPLENTATEGGGIYASLMNGPIGNNVIQGNEATLQGGGVLLDYFSNCTVVNNDFSDNSAGTSGGGLACRYSTVAEIGGCQFTANSAGVAGGGLSFNDNCTGSILSSTISNNLATGVGVGVGGGIYMGNNVAVDIGQEVKGIYVDITGNRAGLSGGGLYLERGCSPTLVHVHVLNNRATAGNGGGIYMRDSCSPEISKGTEFGFVNVEDNFAGMNGGGIFIGQGCSPVIGTGGEYNPMNILNNTADNFGGGVCMLQADAPALYRISSINNNTAKKGGGIYAGADQGSISRVGIYSNKAVDTENPANAQGGGVYVPPGSHVSVGFTAGYNTATDGGGFYCAGSGATIGRGSLYENTAYVQGGGAHCANGDESYWTSVDVDSNHAPLGPGVYVTDSSPTFNGNTIENHYLAAIPGAGFRAKNSTILFERNLLLWNGAPYGAGLYEEDCTMTILGNTVQGNQATVKGAGMYITSETVSFGNTSDSLVPGNPNNVEVIRADVPQPNNFVDNYAPIGAGLYISPGLKTIVSGCLFGENIVDNVGAGVYADGSSPRFYNSLFIGNSAEKGAGLYVKGSSTSPSVKYCTFIGNTARQYASGGGIYTESSGAAISNSIFWGNRHDIKGATPRYSNVQDTSSGIGNMNADPLLAGAGFSEQWEDKVPGDDQGIYADIRTFNTFVNLSSGTTLCQFVTDEGIVENQFAGYWLNPNIRQNRLFYIIGNSGKGGGVNGGTDIWVNGWITSQVPDIARPGDTFQIWDFHEKSTGGRFSALDDWIIDSATSPCVNSGNPADSAANEPAPNGGRVNMGAYGGGAQASKSGQVTPGGFQHGIANIDSSWTTVVFSEPFPSVPVVVASPATENSAAPGVVRLRNIGRSSFQVRFQPWPYLSGTHGAEKVHWMACATGVWDLGNDQQVIADAVDTNNTRIASPLTVRFPQAFAVKPAVFAQVQTYNDATAVTHRITTVSASYFKVCMQEQERSDQRHNLESIGYIAISPGATMIAAQSVSLAVTGNVVTHNPYLVVTNLGQCAIRVSEETSAESSTSHVGESIAYIALGGQPPVVADMQTARGTDPCTLRAIRLADSLQYEAGQVRINSSWHTYTFQNTYVQPILVVGPATLRDSGRGVIRLRNVRSHSFQARFQEWSYNTSKKHVYEDAAYIVCERGAWNVDGGRMLLADKLSTNNTRVASPSTINFSARFSATPRVVATQQTASGSDAVTERMRNISATRFQIALQTEVLNAAHKTETVGYLALGTGNRGIVAGSIQIRSGVGNPADWRISIIPYRSGQTHRSETIGYLSVTSLLRTKPYFVAAMQTINDRNLATLRCKLR